jgi:hypothetical protein
LVVAVEEGSDVAPDEVRRAVASELGTPVVGPRDEASSNAGRLEVRSKSGVLKLSYRDAQGRTIEREVTAPSDGAARVRMIALLAGNLARNEAEELVPPKKDATATPAADDGSRVTVQLSPGDQLQMKITPAVAPAEPKQEAPRPLPPPPPAPDETHEGGTQRTLGWLAMGAGAVSAGVGVYFGTRAPRSDQTVCGPGPGPGDCSPSSAAIDSARRSDIVTQDLLLGAGALLGATGVVLVLTAPSGHSPVAASVGLGPRSLELRGTF